MPLPTIVNDVDLDKKICGSKKIFEQLSLIKEFVFNFSIC